MALIEITRQPSTLHGYQLNPPTDMITALNYLSTRGYTGSVVLTKNGNDPVVWTLTLQSGAGTSGQAGVTGSWVVIENDAIATIVPEDKAAAMYAPA